MGLNQAQNEFLDSLYRDMAPLMTRYALASISDISQAEEVVQDTFRIACTRIEEIMASPNPKGWLMNTLKFVIHDSQRAKARYLRMLCAVLSAGGDKRISYDLEVGLDVLYGDIVNSDDFLLLERVYLQNRSLREIAEEDGITLEACKKRVQRAKKRLRTYIQENHII